AHPGERLFAGRIDLRHADRVGHGERLREAVGEMQRARVEVRLEERQEPSLAASRGEVGGELRRVVRVAVEDDDAARLALRLEPAARPAKLDDDSLGVTSGHAGDLEGGERRGGIPPVVLSGYGELERDGV